jgi:hypothetical protein
MDDLFGGLPAVSSNAGGNASLPSVADAVDRRPKPVLVSATKNDDEKKEVSTKNDNDEKQSSSSDKQPSSKQTATSSSLVNSIGTAGTMMAFVPHATRNKKRKVGGSGSHHTRTMAKQDSAVSQPSSSSAQLVVDSNINDNDDKQKSPSEIIVHMKSDTPSVGGAENDNIRDDDYNNNDCNNDNDDDDNDEPYLDNEPEAMRLLHASVTQPYDPFCPNDYLAYRERKKMEQIRKDMQASALQRLEQQEMLRKKVEEERKKLLESGDFSKIVEKSRGDREGAAVGRGVGKGRGRGVTNLPAWLVKKQDEQKEEMDRSAGHIDDGQFDDYAI